MKTFLVSVALGLLSFASDTFADGPKATLEFRLAVADSADGYSKHSVAETDDFVYVSDKNVATGRDIEKVSFSDGPDGKPMVGFVLTEEGSNTFYTATSENIGKKIAILLDGKVISAPNINSPIKKEASITGDFDDEDLLRFFTAIVLRKTTSATESTNGG